MLSEESRKEGVVEGSAGEHCKETREVLHMGPRNSSHKDLNHTASMDAVAQDWSQVLQARDHTLVMIPMEHYKEKRQR